jgi:thymidylate synthase
MLEFDLRRGFPAVTTKRLAFKQVAGELIGFLRGATTASEFRDLGCSIWDQNANENEQWLKNTYRKGTDDLGRIYGAQWRDWRAEGQWIDQIDRAVDKIKNNPDDRRNIVTAWNPGELDKMALPPCHIMHQYLCDKDSKELSMTMYMRSCDMFLGVPFNIASYALLLSIMAKATGYVPKKLVMFLADVHIYENHLDQVREQLSRQPYELPELHMAMPTTTGALYAIETLRPEDMTLLRYKYHPAIKAPMAV